MLVREVLQLNKGSVVPLDRMSGDPADILVQAGDSPGMNGGNSQRNINLSSSIDPTTSFVLGGFI